MAFLTPDNTKDINGVLTKEFLLTNHNVNNIIMPSGNRKKTVAITIHNTGAIDVASGTTMAEQYTRATYYGNMKDVRVQYYVDQSEAWNCMPDDYVNWSCADGTSNPDSGNNTSVAIEIIGDNPKAEDNGARLAAYLLKKYNLTVDSGLRTHTYWLNVKDGKRGSIDELNVMYNSYKNCMPIDQTELLTPDGWKSLADIKKGDIVAQYDNGNIEFVNTIDVVEPYESEVIKCRNLEATADHRMLACAYNDRYPKFKEISWGDVLSTERVYKIPTYGNLNADGLNLLDEELLLLAWIQGDGSYMHYDNGEGFGIEFHFAKQRKIDRLHEILDSLEIEYRDGNRSDGTFVIRIYNKELCNWAKSWLDNKKFTFKMLNMTDHQFEIFMEELYIIDGHKDDRQKMYCSTEKENLDFVQALCATHGVRTTLTTMGSSRKYYGEQPVNINILRTNASFKKLDTNETRATLVSCVTVPSSYILIRQYNRVYVVGNCPIYIIPHWRDFKNKVQQYFNELNGSSTPTPTPTPVVESLYRVRKSWNDASSQKGAYKDLDNAKSACPEGYNVYDEKGNVVYSKPSTPTPTPAKVSITNAEVKELQRILNVGRAGLVVDGIIGPKTLAAVKKYTVEQGDTGNLICWVQKRLNTLGFNCGLPDGIAGNKTMNAIYAFQKANGLGIGYLGGTDYDYLLK